MPDLTPSSRPSTASGGAGAVRDFLVPDLGEGLEEATLVEWHAAIGATVELNGPLCVLETAKATVDIPSPFAGRLVERRGQAGDTLAVGSLLARIATAPVAAGTAAVPPGAQATPPARAVTDGAAETPRTPESASPPDTAHRAASSGARRTATLVGYGVDDEQDRSRRSAGATARPTPGTPAPISGTGRFGTSARRPLARPPVRLLARRLEVDLSRISPGSGPNGVVTKDDVLTAAAAAQPGGQRLPDVADRGRQPSGAAAHAAPPTADTIEPVRGIRARIADRMTLSRSRIPDATCGVTVDCSRLLETRGRLNAAAERAGAPPKAITPFALIVRLLVQALTTHPTLNATFLEDGPAIRTHGGVHLGVGTATDRGLLVVVVRDAHTLTTLELANEISRLAAAARAGRATPAELTGSTFTVSNFGALGLDEGIPVINYPEAAILGVGSVRPRPVVVDGEVVARPTAALTCAFDHRVADGAEAGRFMSELAALIENPDIALLRA